MAFHLHIDPARSVGAIRYHGAVDGREIVRAIGQMLSHPDWRPGFKRFSSTVAVTQMDVTPADLEAMQQQDTAERARIGRGPKAIVVAPQYEVVSVMYKYMFDSKMGLYELAVFTDEAAAWHWLSERSPGERLRALAAKAPEDAR